VTVAVGPAGDIVHYDAKFDARGGPDELLTLLAPLAPLQL